MFAAIHFFVPQRPPAVGNIEVCVDFGEVDTKSVGSDFDFLQLVGGGILQVLRLARRKENAVFP